MTTNATTSYDIFVRGSMAIVLVEYDIPVISTPTAIRFDFAVPPEAVILLEDTLYTPPKGGVSHPRTTRTQPYPGILGIDVDNHEIGGALTSRLQYALPVEFTPAPTLRIPTDIAHVLTPWREFTATDQTTEVTVRSAAGRVVVASGPANNHPLGVPIRVEIGEHRPSSVQGVAGNGAAVDVSIDPRLNEGPAHIAIVTDIGSTALLSEHFATTLKRTDTVVQVGPRGLAKAKPRQPLRPTSDVAADVAKAAADPSVSDILVATHGGKVGSYPTLRGGYRIHALAVGTDPIGNELSDLVRQTGGTCLLVESEEGTDLAYAVAGIIAACRRPRSTIATRGGGKGATKAIVYSPTATVDILVSPEPPASHSDEVGGFVEGMIRRIRA